MTLLLISTEHFKGLWGHASVFEKGISLLKCKLWGSLKTYLQQVYWSPECEETPWSSAHRVGDNLNWVWWTAKLLFDRSLRVQQERLVWVGVGENPFPISDYLLIFSWDNVPSRNTLDRAIAGSPVTRPADSIPGLLQVHVGVLALDTPTGKGN
jgi:hypothetical protein